VAIGKPRGKAGQRPVYVYDPRLGRKVYVGSRKNLRGDDGAQALERAKTIEFQRADPTDRTVTIDTYAEEWLELHHGPGTRRPADSTLKVNRGNLRPFLAEYGGRPVDGGVSRREALRWSKLHKHNAVVVCAMFNDAIDDEITKSNPFAGRRQEESRERKHIHPLTEAEVCRLADIALRHWGGEGYGLTAWAWVLFGAWVGCRPGETFTVQARDLDFAAGEVTVRRVKKRGGTYPTDTVVLPAAAIDAIRAMPVIPASGPLFTTVTGKPFQKGNLRHHWDPVRAAFRETVPEERWLQLLDDTMDDGTRRRAKSLDFYVLRHHCASIMADRGATARDIAHQLGNSEQVCRETYIHHFVDRTNERVRGLLDGPRVHDLDQARRRREGNTNG
jgi:integrase